MALAAPFFLYRTSLKFSISISNFDFLILINKIPAVGYFIYDIANLELAILYYYAKSGSQQAYIYSKISNMHSNMQIVDKFLSITSSWLRLIRLDRIQN